MEQPKRLPSIARATFLVHLVVAIALGAPMLISPIRAVGWFGFPAAMDFRPFIRSFGAIILVFGGLTSLYGYLARSWESIKYIVHAEIAYLSAQTLVYLVSLIIGSGPALGNWLSGAISLVLLALFVATFVSRPK